MIVCCGEALIDMVKTPVPGSGEGFLPLAGGSPYNTAIAIGRLGAPVQFLGRFSSDWFGELLVNRLRANNVGGDLLIRCGLNSTLAFVSLEEGKEPQYNFYTDGTAGCSLLPEDIPAALPAGTSCILFGSISMTLEPIASTIENFILRNQAEDSPVISFDPNIRPFMIKDREAYVRRFEKWAAASVIVKISAADFEFIYPGLDVEQALRKVLSMGPGLAICTLGSGGAVALLRRGGGVVRAAAPGLAVTVADTIGAGDSFHGAFLAWLQMHGKMSRSAIACKTGDACKAGDGCLSETDLRDALLFANKAAAIVCSRRGAEPPSLEEIELFENTGL